MAAHRRSGRFVSLAVISGPLVVAGIVGAGPARADATSYLSHLHNVRIQEVGGDSALLDTGQKMCVELADGASPNQLTALALQRSDAREGARALTPVQASELVDYAIVDLCPNY
jgi:Protein of unknown function (DUF732)